MTIDALLSFTRTLSREEADRLAKEVPGIFEREGFQAGMERCASLVREYPDSQYLKLKVAGLYTPAPCISGRKSGQKRILHVSGSTPWSCWRKF